jgi:hypothetical protein
MALSVVAPSGSNSEEGRRRGGPDEGDDGESSHGPGGPQMQELAVAQKRLDDLQASRADEAQQVWSFMGQTDAVLVPLSFSPVCTGFPT